MEDVFLFVDGRPLELDLSLPEVQDLELPELDLSGLTEVQDLGLPEVDLSLPDFTALEVCGAVSERGQEGPCKARRAKEQARQGEKALVRAKQRTAGR